MVLPRRNYLQDNHTPLSEGTGVPDIPDFMSGMVSRESLMHRRPPAARPRRHWASPTHCVLIATELRCCGPAPGFSAAPRGCDHRPRRIHSTATTPRLSPCGGPPRRMSGPRFPSDHTRGQLESGSLWPCARLQRRGLVPPPEPAQERAEPRDAAAGFLRRAVGAGQVRVQHRHRAAPRRRPAAHVVQAVPHHKHLLRGEVPLAQAPEHGLRVGLVLDAQGVQGVPGEHGAELELLGQARLEEGGGEDAGASVAVAGEESNLDPLLVQTTQHIHQPVLELWRGESHPLLLIHNSQRLPQLGLVLLVHLPQMRHDVLPLRHPSALPHPREVNLPRQGQGAVHVEHHAAEGGQLVAGRARGPQGGAVGLRLRGLDDALALDQSELRGDAPTVVHSGWSPDLGVHCVPQHPLQHRPRLLQRQRQLQRVYVRPGQNHRSDEVPGAREGAPGDARQAQHPLHAVPLLGEQHGHLGVVGDGVYSGHRHHAGPHGVELVHGLGGLAEGGDGPQGAAQELLDLELVRSQHVGSW
mmetsp:Transcript_23160/g.59507  ORF Transcript_23160/g.59507 Transcript_23160/m.59507 type:complete len:526 (+) Transcript_23160:479-2056(+)